MERDGRLALSVGLFVLVALVALAASILSLTSERGLFLREYRLRAAFANVQGLQAGAPVWLAGKEIGRVEEIRFEPEDRSVPVLAILAIDENVREFVRADSVASIGTIGVLGDSYIELSVGSATEPTLGDGESVRTLTPVNMNQAMAQATAAAGSLRELSENLNSAIESFNDAEGGSKLTGAVDDVSTAVKAATDAILAVRDGNGLLHRLIYDDFGVEGFQSLERSLAAMESVMGEVANGQGILHTLIYEKPQDQDVVNQVMAAGARLNSILSKIDSGEGTIGLLVNDPGLYEDMQVLVGGAQRSLLIRSMVRMAVDAGDDDEEEQAPKPSGKGKR
jgi:phospholipid/cholesterol/gamma-HCH transport system substrate-binding protein